MKIEEILQELDQLFASRRISEIEPFLKTTIEKAGKEGSVDVQVTLLNELMGFYRDLGEYEKSIAICQQVMELMQTAGLTDTIAYATTQQNVANALRGAGQLEASMKYYNSVFHLYQDKLEPNDMRYASLYNNKSLLYQEMQDFENACTCLENALVIVKQHSEAMIEVATTHTNLAMSLLKLEKQEDAMKHLERAFAIFQQDEEKDYHYSAALATMAEVKYRAGQLEEAAHYYQEAMKEIERNTGRTQNYLILEKNLQRVYEEMETVSSKHESYETGIEICEAFYKAYGIPMLQREFPEYEALIAVGLVGEGSDCFGFDDQFSRDHDFGPGFCMWISDSIYDEIGGKLQEAYDKLPTTFMGVKRINMSEAGKRVGVFRISEFYTQLIGVGAVPEFSHQWLFIEDYQLAAATNGKVFRDDLGEFSRIRRGLLQYYPQEVYLKKLAITATRMAQTGQYNYGRMLQRNDRFTAHISLVEFMKHTMTMMYLLNHTYAPFYKWQFKGMDSFLILPKVKVLLEELELLSIGDVGIPERIEEIAVLIVNHLKMLELTHTESTFLAHHSGDIIANIEEINRREEIN